jgi:Na+/pantothenate symporter
LVCWSQGGLRTVAMTGSLQLAVMLFSTVALLTAGLVGVGGPAVVWQRMAETGRAELFK